MIISVIAASGNGKTSLSSFDNALKHAGVCNYNLIVLSSIIPRGARIKKIKQYTTPSNEYGHRLYVVKAEAHASDPHIAVAAGVGWYQFADKSGVFVEHDIEGLTSKSARDALTEIIYTSLSDLCAFREEKFHQNRAGISIAMSDPGEGFRCALSLAVYKSEPW